MAVNLNFNDVVSNAAQLYITGVANGTIGLPTLVASGAILASAGTSTPPTWANELNLFSGTKTASTPILNLTQTWDNAGVTFIGMKLNVTDTASATGSLLMDLQVGGSGKFNVDKVGSVFSQGTLYAQGGSIRVLNNAGVLSLGTNNDVILARDASNTLALRNGANAQAFNVYNTYTDASNYERGLLGWGSNLFVLGTEKAGTGIARALQIRIDGDNVWQFNTAGHLVANSDNTFDIGVSGANRPRNVYTAGNLVAAGALFTAGSKIAGQADGVFRFSNNAGTQTVDLTIGASNLLTLNGGLTANGDFTLSSGNQILFGANARITDSAPGNLLLSTSGTGTGFGLLQGGGTTSAFPAWKRSGVNWEARLADDTDRTGLVVGSIDAAGNVISGGFLKSASYTVGTVPSASAAGAGARSFVTDATATTFMSVVAGGGANKVPVVSDGTNWLIG